MTIGNWVFITGSHQINQEYFNKSFPQGFFGRIIEIKKRFSQFDGRKLPNKILVRVYRKGKKIHIITTEKYIELYKS